jgi:hypothetical protein
MEMRTHRAARRSRAGALLTVLSGALAAGACEVVNPGPVDDEFIALPASQQGLVNGSWERLNRVVGWSAYDEALPTREIFHGGQTGNYGHAVARQAGNMGGWTASGRYNEGQQARWVAEEAIRQFEARGDVAPALLTEAYLAAGYANRYNGDYWCWGVIDGGPLVPGKHYWERAEGHFTKAIASAPDNASRHAAYAGRAQTRLQLGNYQGAIDDAKQVPMDFSITVAMDGVNGAQRNHVFFGNADNPYRGWTVTHTFFHKYYTDTGDPRTPWRDFPNATSRVCVGGLTGYPGTSVPCTQQQKYKSESDDIRMAGGPEMRLIEAEAILRLNPGNWQAAMALINEVRTRNISVTTRAALAPWTANNLDEAWTYLMRERYIEMWLEARRIADMRRWEPLIREYGTFAADGQTVLTLPQTTPGVLDFPRYEELMNNPSSNIFTANLRGRPAIEDQDLPRELCYNISNTERQSNPNFLESGEP